MQPQMAMAAAEAAGVARGNMPSDLSLDDDSDNEMSLLVDF
jgi:hypothetical protein